MGKTEMQIAPEKGALYILCRLNTALCVNRYKNGVWAFV